MMKQRNLTPEMVNDFIERLSYQYRDHAGWQLFLNEIGEHRDEFHLVHALRQILEVGSETSKQDTPLYRLANQIDHALDREKQYYNYIDEIKKANADIGQNWFDPDTMCFFRSRILPTVYGGHLFISSEVRFGQGPRMYSIRSCTGGRIDTVGEVMQYSTADAARKEIRRILSEESQKGE